MREFYCRPFTGGGYGSGNGLSYANAFNGLSAIDWDAINADLTQQNVLRIAGFHGAGSFSGDATMTPVISASHQYQTIITGLAFDSGVGDPGSILTCTESFSGTAGWTDLGSGIYSRSLTGSNGTHVFEGGTTMGSSLSRMKRMLFPPSEDAAGWAAATGAFFAERTNSGASPLYIKPTNALASTRIYRGAIDNTIDLTGVNNVAVKNMNLYGANFSTVRIRNCTDVVLEDNLMQWAFRGVLADQGYYATRVSLIGNTISKTSGAVLANGADAGVQKNNWKMFYNTIDDVDSDAYYGHQDSHAVVLEGGSDHQVLFNRVNKAGGSSLMLDFYQNNTQHRNYFGHNLLEHAQTAEWYSYNIKWVRENATTLRANNNPGAFFWPTLPRVRVSGATTAAFEARGVSLTADGTDWLLVLDNLGGTINADPFIAVELNMRYLYDNVTPMRLTGGFRQQIENTNYDPNDQKDNWIEKNLIRDCGGEGIWMNTGKPTSGFTFQYLDNYILRNGVGMRFDEEQPNAIGFRMERSLFSGNTVHIRHRRASPADTDYTGVTLNNNNYVDDGAAKFKEQNSGVDTDYTLANWKTSNRGGWDAASDQSVHAPIAASLETERANFITTAIANRSQKTTSWAAKASSRGRQRYVFPVVVSAVLAAMTLTTYSATLLAGAEVNATHQAMAIVTYAATVDAPVTWVAAKHQAMTSTSYSATIDAGGAEAGYYVATTGNDTTGDGSFATPWATIGYGISQMIAGDTLIVKDGTYTGIANFIDNMPAGVSTSNMTTIKAQNPFGVRIASSTTLTYPDSALEITGNYVEVDGFIFDMSNTDVPTHIGDVSGSYCTVKRCIFKRSGNIDAFGGWFYNSGNYNLFEDLAGCGAMRYGFEQGGPGGSTNHTIWRRCVGRCDYSNSQQPKATFATYGNNDTTDVTDHLYQNCIAVDGQYPSLGGELKYGAFYHPKNATNVDHQGCIVLNEGVGHNIMFSTEWGLGNHVEHTVAWESPTGESWRGGIKANTADRVTIGGTRGTGDATDLDTPATNSLIDPVSPPTNLLDNNPGAVVLKQYGVSGTRWGDTGYNTLTAVDLWPWPYEDKIKAVFAETNNPPGGNSPSTNTTTRGFCTTGLQLNGVDEVTLTSYIWEFTGTQMPVDLYGGAGIGVQATSQAIVLTTYQATVDAPAATNVQAAHQGLSLTAYAATVDVGAANIVHTDLTSGFSDTNTTSVTTASVIPSENALIEIAVEVSFFTSQSDATPDPVVTGNGITYALVAKSFHWPDGANWWNCLYLYRGMSGSPTTGAITVDFGAVVIDTYAWSVSQKTGVDTSGTNGSGAIVQAVTNAAATVTDLTVTLAAFSSSNNATAGYFGAGDLDKVVRTFTPGTGFTEIHDTGIEYSFIGTQWRQNNDTTVDTTISSAADGLAGIAVEIKAA